MIKDKALCAELKKNVRLSDCGDTKAKYKVETIWRLFKTTEITKLCDPIMVIYPDGQSEIYPSKVKTKKACNIGHKTLQRCIDTGEADSMGRCYDYLIVEEV